MSPSIFSLIQVATSPERLVLTALLFEHNLYPGVPDYFFAVTAQECELLFPCLPCSQWSMPDTW